MGKRYQDLQSLHEEKYFNNRIFKDDMYALL